MNQIATQGSNLRALQPEIGQGRRARLARAVRRSGTLHALQAARDALLGGVRILAYHRILESAEPAGFVFDPGLISASASAFDAQMAIIKRRYRPMSLGDVLGYVERGEALPARAVVITFDDGYEDNHRVAFPILRKHGIPATFFVSTAHIDSGRPYAFDWLYHMICTTEGARCRIPDLGIDAAIPSLLTERRELAAHVLDRIKLLDALRQEAVIMELAAGWDMPPPASVPSCRPMTWAQVQDLHAAGMEIGSHGMHHRMLSKLDDQALANELAGSRAALLGHIDAPVAVLSYPVGGRDAFDARVVEAARRSGFMIGCSYIEGVDKPTPANVMSLRRIAIERDMDLAWFEALLAIPETFSYATKHRVG